MLVFQMMKFSLWNSDYVHISIFIYKYTNDICYSTYMLKTLITIYKNRFYSKNCTHLKMVKNDKKMYPK